MGTRTSTYVTEVNGKQTLSATTITIPARDRTSVSAANLFSVVSSIDEDEDPAPPAADTTAPTITSSDTQTVAENVAFSLTLTADEAVTWSKTGGADSALFTLVGAALTMTAKDYETPTDADANNTYVVQVTATDAALNATAQTITVTVTDVGEAVTQFLLDTFTGTNGTILTSHTGETGATWTLQSGYTVASGSVKINNNEIYNSDSNQLAFSSSGVPGSADYYVEAGFKFIGSSTNDTLSVCARMQSGANTMYFFRYNGATALWAIFKVVAGVATSLGTFSQVWPQGTTVVGKLTVTGTTLNAYLDGVLKIGPITDSAISLAGTAGVRMTAAGSSTTGLHLTYVSAST